MLITLLTLFLAFQTPAPSTSQAVALRDQGLPWTEYLASTKLQRDLWVRNADRNVPAALVERLRAAGHGLQLLVVSEDGCSDSVNTVPYLGTLASKAGIDMRVVTSGPGKPVMEAHRTPDGRAATPTVILIRDGKDVAAWVERPSALQSWILGPGAALEQSDRYARKMSWYEWNRGDDTLREIVVLAEQTIK